MVHTNTLLVNYHNEDAFCSGHGSIANTPTELVEADLTAVDRLLKFNSGVPKPEREDLFHLASGLTPDLTMTKWIKPGAGSIESYMQTSYLYDWAVSATLGTTGTSKAFRYKSPYRTTEIDLYGCQVLKWEQTIERGKAIIQAVDFQTNRAKTASITPIAGSGIKAFSAATPKMFNELILTVDSKATADMQYNFLKFTIENEYATEDDACTLASLYEINPVLTARTYSFEVGYLRNGSETWDEDELNATAQLVTSSINNGLYTLAPTNFTLWTTNQDELESRGIIKRKATFRQGVGATNAKS